MDDLVNANASQLLSLSQTPRSYSRLPMRVWASLRNLSNESLSKTSSQTAQSPSPQKEKNLKSAASSEIGQSAVAKPEAEAKPEDDKPEGSGKGGG